MTNTQRAANRANALKSTGPRTASGKRRSALNALKHGVFTRSFYEAMKVFGEDPAEFERLHRDFAVSFDPQTPFEAALVEDLTRLWWRKLRLDRGENGMQVMQVEQELLRRRREESDTADAPIEEGDEAIKQSGLMRIKDSRAKFAHAANHLETALAQAERGDPDFDADTLIFFLYGQQPNWRGSFILYLAENLKAAEERAEQEANEAAAGDGPPEDAGEGDIPPIPEPPAAPDPAAAEVGNPQSSIGDQQSFDSPSPDTEPTAGDEPTDDEDASPKVLRALLVNELVGELVEVYREHTQFLEQHMEFSPAARDACLAPSGAQWPMAFDNRDSLERAIDRKLRQLRTLQSAAEWSRAPTACPRFLPNPEPRIPKPESRSTKPARRKHQKS